jgi:hypothetical protein
MGNSVGVWGKNDKQKTRSGNPGRVFWVELKKKLQGERTPVIQFGFFGLATFLFAGFFVVTAGTDLTQRAFTIQLLFKPA